MSRRKIAVSLDPDLVAGVERLRRRTRESRSAVVDRALALLLAHEERTVRVAHYVDAYRMQPETLADVARARATAKAATAHLAWDDE